MHANFEKAVWTAQCHPKIRCWKFVLLNLCYHANAEGEAFPGITTIARETGYTERAVKDALAGLEALGIIKLKGRCGQQNRVSMYDITGVSTNVDNLINGEVSSKKRPFNGEVSSVNGEVSSSRSILGSNKLVSKLVSSAANGEVSSPFVDNSKKPVRNPPAEGSPSPHGPWPRQNGSKEGRVPRKVEASDLFPQAAKPDYLKLCAKLGWKPNDPAQTPPEDAELARRAVVTCAYREGLSMEEAKKFLQYNAKMKWNAIDQANCVKDLAKAFLEAWKRRDRDAFWEELDRRNAAKKKAAKSGQQ